MAKIISLCGTHDTGKTTIINEVIKELVADTEKIYQTEVDKGYPIPRGKKGDQVVVFTRTDNNQKIGITTRGDDETALKKDFEAMKECEVYVCASRTSQGTQFFLRDREKEMGDRVVFFHTWEEADEPERKKRNEVKKEEIIDAIKYFCK